MQTKGPWIARQFVSGNWQIVADETGEEIARTMATTDAEFIVRACNSHASLVAALEGLRDAVNDTVMDGTLKAEIVDTHPAMLAARAALRDAKGEA